MTSISRLKEHELISAAEEILIHDEVGIRDLLSEILRDEGYQVSGQTEKAPGPHLSRASASRPSVLLDIWMPTRRRDAAARMGGQWAVDDAGGHHVRSRHYRNRGRGDQDRRVRLSGKAGWLAKALVDSDAGAQGRSRAGAASCVSHGSWHQRSGD